MPKTQIIGELGDVGCNIFGGDDVIDGCCYQQDLISHNFQHEGIHDGAVHHVLRMKYCAGRSYVWVGCNIYHKQSSVGGRVLNYSVKCIGGYLEFVHH